MRDNDLRKHLGLIGVSNAILELETAGYDVATNGHNDPADLIVNGHLRIEIKASLWTKHKHSSGRYQFNTRQSPDLYILYCLGYRRTAFVVPGSAIGDRHNIAIWTLDPHKYQGQWSQYLDAWHLVERTLQQCHNQQAAYTGES